MKRLLLTILSLFLYLNIFGQTYQWVDGIGGGFNDFGNSIAVDVSGSVYGTGAFSSSITFGASSVTNQGNLDFLLTKYDNSGTQLWATSAGSSLNDEGKCVDVDAFGNVYAVGYFNGSSINFDGNTLNNAGDSGTSDMFLVKYDSLGNVIWANRAGGNGFDEYVSCVVDPSGNGDIYVAGGFSSDYIIYGTDTLFNGGNKDLLLAKYDANGNILWAKNGGIFNNGCQINSIAADQSGNVYVAGSFSTTIIFGFDTLSISGGGTNMFLAKYNNNGKSLWARAAEGTGILVDGKAVTVDPSGNCSVTGTYAYTSIAFGSDTLTHFDATSYSDIFIVKYDTNGNPIWARSLGGSNTDVPKAVAYDVEGNIYLGGYFNSLSLYFDSDSLTNTGGSSMFIIEFDNNGLVQWADQAKPTCAIHALATDEYNNVYLTGLYEEVDSPISIGSTTLSPVGELDIFFAKIGSSTIGVLNHKKEFEMSIHPNPFTVSTTVYFNANLQNATVKVYDILGIEVMALANIYTDRIIIEKNNLTSGLYFVQLIIDNQIVLVEEVVITN